MESKKGCCPICGEVVKDIELYRKNCDTQLQGVCELLEGEKRYILKHPPFEWLESWLKAYDIANNTDLSKKIMEWINQAPMANG